MQVTLRVRYFLCYRAIKNTSTCILFEQCLTVGVTWRLEITRTVVYVLCPCVDDVITGVSSCVRITRLVSCRFCVINRSSGRVCVFRTDFVSLTEQFMAIVVRVLGNEAETGFLRVAICKAVLQLLNMRYW